MKNPHYMLDDWGMGPGMFFMIFFWLLVLALIVTLIWLANVIADWRCD